jgi:predicted nucleic acid-binding protein
MLVLDASVTLAWLLPDERSTAADAVFERVARESALVPPLWSLEVGNGLLAACRRSRLSDEDLATAVRALRELPIRPGQAALDSDFGAVLTLARRHGLTTYDAAYLELALRAATPLATLDDRLRAAAVAERVQIVPGQAEILGVSLVNPLV